MFSLLRPASLAIATPAGAEAARSLALLADAMGEKAGAGGPTSSATAAVGVATFGDLAVVQRGPDYRVNFEVSSLSLSRFLALFLHEWRD